MFGYKKDELVTLCSYSLSSSSSSFFYYRKTTMISSTATISSSAVKSFTTQDQYTAIPHFPACLGGEWKNIVKTPYLKTTMKFKAGASLVK